MSIMEPAQCTRTATEVLYQLETNETYISSNKILPSAANRIAYSTVENNEISLKTMPWVKVISIITKFEQNFGIWNCEI